MPHPFVQIITAYASQMNVRLNRMVVVETFEKVGEEVVNTAFAYNKDNAQAMNTSTKDEEFLFKADLKDNSTV